MKKILFAAILGLLLIPVVRAQDATEIVRKADDKMRGENSSIMEMTMKIVRPTYERTISFKSWSKGTEKSAVLITAPAKEEGQSFLKLDRDMWTWNPVISRMIKMPPSMLSQGWMGSDYTNDDLLNQRSVVVDYNHKIIGSEKLENQDCYKIELDPKEDAPVVWGKIIFWITKKDYLLLKSEYYDEDGYLVKTELGEKIKSMDGRVIPTVYELIPADKPGNKTIVIMDNIKFNANISDNFFTQQNMKRLH